MRGEMTVKATTTDEMSVHVSGLKAGSVWFHVEGDGELLQVIQALTEAGGFYIHLPDGCEDDGCPCRQRAKPKG